MEKKRKNITISTEISDWYEKKSRETGMTQSSLMAMALSQYIKMEEMNKTVITSLDELMQDLEKHKQ